MKCDPQKVIRIALAEVGYHEKETNAQLDDKTANAGDGNFTKYARDLAKENYFNGSKTGVEWCSVFVAWGMRAAYGLKAALKLLCQRQGAANAGAGVKYAKQYFQDAGRFHTAPKTGDVIFFTRGHMGLVYDVDNTYVYTVEGNTQNQVLEHRYRINDEGIDGYGRPDYEGTEDGNTEDETEAKPMGKTAYVTASSGKTVRLREGMSDSAETIVKVPLGTVVEVVEQGNRDGVEWATIIDPDGRRGYMMAKFLKVLEYADEKPIPSDDVSQNQPSGISFEETVLNQMNRLETLLNAVLDALGVAG